MTGPASGAGARPPSPPPEELLTRVPLFAGLGRVELAQLSAHLDPIALDTGDEVFRQGEPGDSLYIVASGRLGVLVEAPTGGHEVRVATFGPGEVFGEMALLSNEPRSATVRADGPSRVLRLGRDRFLELSQKEPSVLLAVADTLSRRLASADRARAQGDLVIAARVDEVLARLPDSRQGAVLEAALLEAPLAPALAAVFGERAAEVGADLAALGLTSPDAARPVLRILRHRLARDAGAADLRARAERVAARLVEARLWDAALGVLARHAGAEPFRDTLARALRAVPALADASARRWVARVEDEEAATDAEIALARAALHEAQGEPGRAVDLLRRALGSALTSHDPSAGSRLAAEIARLGEAESTAGGAVAGAGFGLPLTEGPRPRSGRWSTRLALAAAVGLTGLALWPGAGPRWMFMTLLVAGIALMASRLVPDFTVGLALVAGWILLGVATPAEALAGFASKEWLFIVAVYGLAAATARSGLLLRVGLVLIRRLPHGLFWQAGTLLVTGLVLTPLIPSSTARASLTAPLALAVADALRLPARGPSAALLGLGAWVGAAPLMFTFLNGSGTCLLAWGLLPEASRARFTWTGWLLAALPLGLFLAAGSLAILFLVLRPGSVARPSGERIRLQVAVLGPPSTRELLTTGIVLATVAGWMAAPWLGLELAVVALLGLLAAVFAGSFDQRALQALDWNVLLFFGVVLTIGRLGVTLGLDRAAASAIDRLLGGARPGALGLVLAVAVVSLVVRLVMEQDLTILLASLTLIPVAAGLGIDPWVVVITLLATSVGWLLPSQTTSYLAARSASEGRLYTQAQAQRFAVAYAALTLLGLALAVPYWRLLGLD